MDTGFNALFQPAWYGPPWPLIGMSESSLLQHRHSAHQLFYSTQPSLKCRCSSVLLPIKPSVCLCHVKGDVTADKGSIAMMIILKFCLLFSEYQLQLKVDTNAAHTWKAGLRNRFKKKQLNNTQKPRIQEIQKWVKRTKIQSSNKRT